MNTPTTQHTRRGIPSDPLLAYGGREGQAALAELGFGPFGGGWPPHPVPASHPAAQSAFGTSPRAAQSAPAVGQFPALPAPAGRGTAPAVAGEQGVARAVRKAIGPAVASAVHSAVDSALENSLENALESSVGSAVSREVREAFDAVLPRIAALMGEGFDRRAFRVEMARYLLDQGVPAKAVAAMSHGYELELATKAMLFDRMASRRAQACAKLDGVPSVLAPRRASHGESDSKRRARAALRKNPNSTEALAALFAAM